jgi:hypothetical protein
MICDLPFDFEIINNELILYRKLMGLALFRAALGGLCKRSLTPFYEILRHHFPTAFPIGSASLRR